MKRCSDLFHAVPLTTLAFLLCLLLPSARASAAVVTWPVYTDKIEWGFDAWSWNGTYSYSNASPAQSGNAAMAATFTSGWASLYLHSNVHIYTDSLRTLRFYIHGGSTGRQQISVGVDGLNGAQPATTTRVSVSPNAGVWTLVEIPLSQFGAVQIIKGVFWSDVTGGAQPTFYVDEVSFVGEAPVPSTVGPALQVDAGADRHAISPTLYGMNFAGESLASVVRLPLNRSGGNSTTRYNWRNGTRNAAADWFFENLPEEANDPTTLPDGSASDLFVEANRRTATASLLTVPLIGWTPKARTLACGFSVAKYGPQQSTDPWAPDCGNGIRPDGSVITGNDPTDTSIAIDASFAGDWVRHLVGRFGPASSGGVSYYNFDNEPDIWNGTHRDVHPQPTTSQEIINSTLAYGAAIKAADPSARTVGPVYWGWENLTGMAADYLDAMRVHEQQTGVRILDYLDVHCYPGALGMAFSAAGDDRQQALRLRSTRMLWDQTYVEEGWENRVKAILPTMRSLVDQHYPGTKLACSEYNWGAPEHVLGALVQAEVLGIFGRDGMDLATIWGDVAAGDSIGFAFRMYRNYDGNGHAFGDQSVRATSADPSRISVFAAQRSGDGALTVMIVNKLPTSLTTTLSLQRFRPACLGRVSRTACLARVYRFSGANRDAIVQQADLPVMPTSVTADFPGYSVTLLVIPQH